MAQVGLKNIYVAKIIAETGGKITYDTPRKIAHAITANITPNRDSAVLYGDDMAVETEEALADIDVELTLTDLNVPDYAFLMGATVDAQGGIVDRVDNVAPYVALGFEIPLSKGGKRLFWYYKGKFGIPSSEHNTKQGSVEYQTPTISGKFLPREDGKWRYRLDATETNADVVADWFNKVQEEATQLP